MIEPPPSSTLTRRRFLQIAAIHAGAMVLGARAMAQQRPERVTWRGIALGTTATIELHGHAEPARAVLRECQAEILRLEGIFSLYDGRSALARLNRTGLLDDAPRELIELITFARTFSELTNGAFDISIQPLCELLASGGPRVSDDAVREALSLVDYRAIECDRTSVRLRRAGMRLTLNGVVQGYITDRVADLLRSRGYTHVLVDVGEKRALGPHADGRAWRIGVESPFARGEILDVVELDERALATSGGYGGRYPGGRHHLLNARSGQNEDTWASLSVLAPLAATADALSTSLAVLPPGAAPELLARFPATEARVVTPDGATHRLPLHDPLRNPA